MRGEPLSTRSHGQHPLMGIGAALALFVGAPLAVVGGRKASK